LRFRGIDDANLPDSNDFLPWGWVLMHLWNGDCGQNQEGGGDDEQCDEGEALAGTV
jgi:hypothetical protein